MTNQKPHRLIFGVGVNDADYVFRKGAVVDGKFKNLFICPFYRVWNHMIERCYSEKYQSRKPTYIGCSVVDSWIYFSNFRRWMEDKPWHGNVIDKDLLVIGNKVYSPETCVFVPEKLNLFVTDNRACRGKFPIGVSVSKSGLKFRASCRNPFTGKREVLGYYTCPQEAHEAWRKRKHEHACRYADMQTDQRIAVALRKRYAKSGGQDE